MLQRQMNEDSASLGAILAPDARGQSLSRCNPYEAYILPGYVERVRRWKYCFLQPYTSIALWALGSTSRMMARCPCRIYGSLHCCTRRIDTKFNHPPSSSGRCCQCLCRSRFPYQRQSLKRRIIEKNMTGNPFSGGNTWI